MIEFPPSLLPNFMLGQIQDTSNQTQSTNTKIQVTTGPIKDTNNLLGGTSSPTGATKVGSLKPQLTNQPRLLSPQAFSQSGPRPWHLATSHQLRATPLASLAEVYQNLKTLKLIFRN